MTKNQKQNPKQNPKQNQNPNQSKNQKQNQNRNQNQSQNPNRQPDPEPETAEEPGEMTVTLTLDDGSEIECVVLTIFEAGGRDYIALLPLDGKETEDGEVYLYRYLEDADGNPDLENIESDLEYDIVSDAFDEFLDTQEYDELVSEEELDEL